MDNTYKKQGFANGQVLTAEHLIKMEDELLDTQEKVEGIQKILESGLLIKNITIKEVTT